MFNLYKRQEREAREQFRAEVMMRHESRGQAHRKRDGLDCQACVQAQAIEVLVRLRVISIGKNAKRTMGVPN